MRKNYESQLNMNLSTASSRLKKLILFDLVQKTGQDKCFRCGELILSADELSIEHKNPWLHSDEPEELFFDLNNIAFSHLDCNCRARRYFPKGESLIEIDCGYCGNKFKKKKRVYKQNIKNGYKVFYCSISCSNSGRKSK